MLQTVDHRVTASLLPRVSRTFALSIAMLPPELREAVRVAYLLCRMADTIEDEPDLEPLIRSRLFAALARLVRDDTAHADVLVTLSQAHLVHALPAEVELMEAISAVLRVYRGLAQEQREAVRPWVLEMIRGMEEYALRDHRMVDLPDLERYCWFVAGTVGHLLTDLFRLAARPRVPEAELRALAEHFGLGLQLVNILKDVAGDLQRGTCFLPVELARSHQVHLSQLLEPDQREAGLALVRTLAGRARHHLEGARAYTLAWPEEAQDVRLFCSLPLTLAWATLEEIERGDDVLLEGREPKVSRELVGRTLRLAGLAAASDQHLGCLLDCYSEHASRGCAGRCGL